MTLTPSALFLEHPAFRQMSKRAHQSLQTESSLVRFSVGQVMASPQVLSNRVLLIVQGQARVLATERGEMVTLAKLQPGDLVGLASLLEANPCEDVSAASEVVAAAIPDELIIQFHTQEPSFREWCSATLWPSELVCVARSLSALQSRASLSMAELLKRCIREATLVPCSKEGLGALGKDRIAYLVSANVEGRDPGTVVDQSATVPRSRPPFPPRLISIPAQILEADGSSLGREGADGIEADPLAVESRISTAPPIPVPTSQDIGQGSLPPPLRLVRGQGPLHETLACFQMLATLLKLPFRRDSIEKALRDGLRRGQTPNLQTLGQLATGLGLHVSGVRVPASAATRLPTPCMVPWRKGFALVTASHGRGIMVASPLDGWVSLKPKEVEQRFPEGIELLIFERTAATPEQRFGLSWFWPAIQRYRGVLLQVFLASFVVQLFTLANPLLIQVIIDKVISQRSLDTLQILGIALVAVTLLEGVISSLRTFLFTETTNRIDMRLGAEVIDHLLRLPLSYFDRRPVGELASRVAELEKIRNFLTGQGLTTILDSLFSVIYIVVMVIYSWLLTLIALSVVPIQVAITLLGSPLFRRQLRQGAEENARTQSHLVEVLTGIQTVKAQNVEMVSRWKWQDLYSRYISRSFERTITGTTVSQTSQVLQKTSQLLVLWVGATLVLKGELTLGQLIAFRIISGYVTQPLLRLSLIWQSIQELKVSIERLADVVDTPVESNEEDQQKIPLPPLKGDITFEDVSFQFATGSAPVLKHISFHIEAGTFVGIVGESGSGKSTLMKLLPRLYAPQTGRILVDGYDIDKVELYSLRRQIGIVPQEPLLFSGTISQNIALTDTEAASDDIVRAARVAAAHDFIMQLPAGYSTQVGERGGGLSGGQKQRIAIARTLLSNPKLLVLDEATSALDYETEKRVCNNLREALSGCTVFFITHRLSTIRSADKILLMHQGVIEESGSHDELMKQRGRYFALYHQQEAGA